MDTIVIINSSEIRRLEFQSESESCRSRSFSLFLSLETRSLKKFRLNGYPVNSIWPPRRGQRSILIFRRSFRSTPGFNRRESWKSFYSTVRGTNFIYSRDAVPNHRHRLKANILETKDDDILEYRRATPSNSGSWETIIHPRTCVNRIPSPSVQLFRIVTPRDDICRNIFRPIKIRSSKLSYRNRCRTFPS